jgi:hypothetical protein
MEDVLIIHLAQQVSVGHRLRRHVLYRLKRADWAPNATS